MQVRPANPSDNAALLRVFAECGMAAKTSLTTLRDPDFFSLTRLQGDHVDIGVAESGVAGVIGCIAVARRRVWLAGVPREVAFIQDLRVRTTHRRQGTGDALLTWARSRTAETLGRSGIAIAASLAGNRNIERRIEGPRQQPVLTDAGSIRLHTILVAGVPAPNGHARLIRSAHPGEGRALAALWERIAPARELAPVLDELELNRLFGNSSGLSLHDFLVIEEHGEPAAFFALWDQRGLRATRVDRYSPGASLIRGLYQLTSRLHHGPALPREGELLHAPAVLFPCVPPHRPDLLRHLLGVAAGRCRTRGYPAFTIALDQGDPLEASLRGLPTVRTVVRLYLTSPEGAYAGPALATGRPLHFEPAFS
jgi:GNAT superfamily N-acetyltransferase